MRVHPPTRIAPLAVLIPLAGAPLSAQQESFDLRSGEPAPEFAEDGRKRIDPAYDQWRSEVLHDAAKPHLKHFVEDLLHGRDFAEVRFAEGFRCSVLRPALETAWNDGVMAVRRAPAIPADWHGRGELAELARAFRAPAGADAAAGNSLIKLVSVEEDGAKAFRIRVFVYGGARSGERVLQWNLEFETSWEIGATDREAALAGVRLLAYEEVDGPVGLLPDYAEEVFGGTPLWREHALFGTEDYATRVDRLFGHSFIGAHGLAVGDLNEDGRDDLFLCQQGGLPNRLWLAEAGGGAREASAAAGLDVLDNTRAALIADFDGDGHPDLATSVGADVAMYWNDGAGRFAAQRIAGEGAAEIYSLAAADADLDGDLDLYACRYARKGLLNAVPVPYHDATNGSPNLYFRNEGARRLVVATAASGLNHNNDRFSMAAVWEDFDDDGDPDLYVVNDFGRNNLYLNEQGRFRDVARERGAEDLAAGMGASVADADLDGHWDLYVTNMFSSAGRRIASQEDRFMGGRNPELHGLYVRHARGNSLLLNDGRGAFRDATDAAGTAVGLWGWGSIFFELDNDGLPDVYAPNGFLTNEKTTDL